MTSIYHRRFFPDDVDATVAYVAPLLFGLEDPRFVDFLRTVGGPESTLCRDMLAQLQRALLWDGDAMIDIQIGSRRRARH